MDDTDDRQACLRQRHTEGDHTIPLKLFAFSDLKADEIVVGVDIIWDFGLGPTFSEPLVEAERAFRRGRCARRWRAQRQKFVFVWDFEQISPM